MDEERECIICYRAIPVVNMHQKMCCVRNICSLCVYKWNAQCGFIKRCMICKKVDDTVQVKKFYYSPDLTNWSNVLSSACVYLTTHECKVCGIRIYRDGGCPNVTCPVCCTRQRLGNWHFPSLLHSFVGVGSLVLIYSFIFMRKDR